MTVLLDASCPVTPLLPYLLNFNATAAEEWAKSEADAFGSALAVGILLTVGSALLLFAGERLTKLALFLCGAVIAFLATLLVTNAALSLTSATPTAACITLIAAPALVGLLGGLLALRFLTMAFACAGFAAGAALGQALYVLILHRAPTGVILLHHDLTFFLCLIVLAVPASILMARHKEALMAIATAAIGAVGLVPGLAILLLSRIDARFLWVTDPTDANEHRASPFVYGQVLAVPLYFLLGLSVQRRSRKQRRADEQVQPYIVYQDGAHRQYGSSAA